MFCGYKNVTDSVRLFVHKNVPQSALFFAYKKPPPPPPISKIQGKIAQRKVSGLCYIKRNANCLAFCELYAFLYVNRQVTQSVVFFVYKCQVEMFYEKLRNVKFLAFWIKKHNKDCLAFCKVSWFLYLKMFPNFFTFDILSGWIG